MALTNPTSLINLQDLQYFETKLGSKYQTQSIAAISGMTATTVEGALSELFTKITTEISKVYKPSGNIAPTELVSSLLVAANVGKVYNLTGEATTTADWVEGAGQTIKAGTDVGIVAVDNSGTTEYKFNAFAGHIDLSNYKTKQTAVTDPSADGAGLSFIDSISQDVNGVITPHKKNVQMATTTDIDEIFS